MKRAWVLAIALNLSLVAASEAKGIQGSGQFVERKGVQEFSGQMVVRPKQAEGAVPLMLTLLRASARPKIEAELRAKVLDYVPETDEYIVRVPKGSNENAYSTSLMATGDFQYAEPDWIVYPCLEPNDPQFGQQWFHTQIGSRRAWDFTQGLPDVIVALTDTGVDLTHPDLAANLVPGYNAVSQLPQSLGGLVDDVATDSHGTFNAGIVGAIGNNGQGVAGIGWQLKIMPVRVSDLASGASVQSVITRGVRWAAEHGANVVNTSYTGVASATTETTGAYIRGLGALSVWGAGNDHLELTGDAPNVIVVGATGQHDERLSFSNYGRMVDVYAPGIQIRSTARNGSYRSALGTSVSAPMVAATCALIMSHEPTFTPDQVEDRLESTCKDLGTPGSDLETSFGRINIGKAIEYLPVAYDLYLLGPNLHGNHVYVIDCGDNAVGLQWGGDPNALDGEPYYAAPPLDDPVNVSMMLGLWSRAGRMSEHGELSANMIPSDFPGILTTFPGFFSFENGSGMAKDCDDNGFIYYGDGWLQRVLTPDGQPEGLFSLPLGATVDASNDGYIVGGDTLFYDSVAHALPLLSGAATLTAKAVTWRGRVVAQADNGHGALFRTASGTLEDLGPGAPTDINSQGQIVGNRDGQAFIFRGPTEGFLADHIPAGIHFPWRGDLTAVCINNRGWIFGHGLYWDDADALDLYRGFAAVPRGQAITTHVDFGFDAASLPIYVGTLPPLLAIQITGESNQPLANVIARVDYESQTLTFDKPETVNEPFRIYVRYPEDGNSEDVPGYLGKLYPSMPNPDEPGTGQPLPLETTYISIADLVPGDINHDNEISIGDYALLSQAFGTFYGDPGYRFAADLNGDLEVSIGDFALLSTNYGKFGD